MRARVLVGGVASAAASAVILFLPGLSIGGPLSDSGGGSDQTVTVQPSQPSSTPLREARARAAGPATPTGYVPPLHGANPHGQGTVGTIDLTPSGTRPLPVDPVTGEALDPNKEEIVVGRSRGEQRADGSYHGHITILSLMGNEVAGVDTNQGETKDGPLDAIQKGVLDPLCPNGVGLICLKLLRAHSETTATSSKNDFKAADLKVASTAGGGSSLAASVAESRGDISSDGTCQTAEGSSLLTNVAIGGGTSSLTAQAASSSTKSVACNNGTANTQTNTSNVINGKIFTIPLGAVLPVLSGVLPAGCGAGTPNTNGGIPTLLPLVCNADDTNGSQTSAPYGVREALAVFVLATPPDSALVKVTAAAAESHAVAPLAGPAGPDGGPGPDGDDGGDNRPGSGGGDDGGGGPGGPAGGDTAGVSNRGGSGAPECSDGIDNDGDGRIDFPNDRQCKSALDDSEAGGLAFTGVNLLMIALAGAIMLAAGLALRTAVTRAPRAAA